MPPNSRTDYYGGDFKASASAPLLSSTVPFADLIIPTVQYPSLLQHYLSVSPTAMADSATASPTVQHQQQPKQEHTPVQERLASEGGSNMTSIADNSTPAQKEEQAAPEHQYPGIAKLSLTLFAICVTVFLVALDQTIIAPALGAITAHFQSTKDIVSIIFVFSNVSDVRTNSYVGLVWSCISTDYNMSPTHIRRNLPPVSRQVDVSLCHIHLRSRKSDMRRRSFICRLHRWACRCWCECYTQGTFIHLT